MTTFFFVLFLLIGDGIERFETVWPYESLAACETARASLTRILRDGETRPPIEAAGLRAYYELHYDGVVTRPCEVDGR